MKHQVVCIPGLSYGPDLFKHQADALADVADLKVVLNQVADSDKMADLILGAFPNGDITLVTHSSVGCFAGYAAAVKCPDRVKKMVLLGACGDFSDQLVGFIQGCIEEIKSGDYDGFKQKIASAALGAGHCDQEALAKEVAATQNLDPDMVVAQCEYICKHATQADQMKNIQAKTLVVQAEKDGFFDLAVGQSVAQLIPDSVFTVIPHIGHMISLENDGATSALLRAWLES